MSEYYSSAIARCYWDGGYGYAFFSVSHTIGKGQFSGGPTVYFNSWETTGFEAQDTTHWFGSGGECFYTEGDFWISDVDFNPAYYDSTASACACIPAPPPDGGGGSDCPGCDANPQPSTGGESPLIIDVLGNGYDLTSVQSGVDFDISPGGKIERSAWTDLLSDDAFLVLDRDGDGLITSGSELFGNHTYQPHSTEPNGFTALRVFDSAEAEGNEDGLITSSDAVFSALRLGCGLISITTVFQSRTSLQRSVTWESKRFISATGPRGDGMGMKTLFRYRAPVTFVGRPHSPRWAYDVFFVVE